MLCTVDSYEMGHNDGGWHTVLSHSPSLDDEKSAAVGRDRSVVDVVTQSIRWIYGLSGEMRIWLRIFVMLLVLHLARNARQASNLPDYPIFLCPCKQIHETEYFVELPTRLELK